MAHWRDARQISTIQSPLYLRTMRLEHQAMDEYLRLATKNFKANYRGRGLDTLPTELLHLITFQLVGSRNYVQTQFSYKTQCPRLEMVCRFRKLCRCTAVVGQAMIMKMISKDDDSDRARGVLDFPPKQSLTELSSVFSNSGFASLVKGITVYAQPHITSHENDLRFRIHDELLCMEGAHENDDACVIANCVVDEFEAHNAQQQKFALQLITVTGSEQMRSLIDLLPHIRVIDFKCHDYWRDYRFFPQEQYCESRLGEPTPNHWYCIPNVFANIAQCKVASLSLFGDPSFMLGFQTQEEEPILRDVTGSLKCITLRLTRQDVMVTGELQMDDRPGEYRANNFSHNSTALNYGNIWERCLASAVLLEELDIGCSKVTGNVSRYLDKAWLKTAIFGQNFPLLKRFALNGAIVKASELEAFMVRHADTLQEVILTSTTCDTAYMGLATMIDAMRDRLHLQRCKIVLYQRFLLYRNSDRVPADLRKILAVYASDDDEVLQGEIPPLNWVDLGLYVMGKETRGRTIMTERVCAHSSDDEWEISETDEEEEEDEDEDEE